MRCVHRRKQKQRTELAAAKFRFELLLGFCGCLFFFLKEGQRHRMELLVEVELSENGFLKQFGIIRGNSKTHHMVWEKDTNVIKMKGEEESAQP
jgi:hypothetical protein